MPEKERPERLPDTEHPADAQYEIRVSGHLGDDWSEWFDGMGVTYMEHGESLIYGPVADQAALHGLLAKVRDLGLTLVLVRRVDLPPAKGTLPASKGAVQK
jgi:hypothetical protein